MYSSVEVLNFKGIHKRTLRLADLTILSGVNAAGKSSFIQALLLARQAARSPHGVAQLNDVDGLSLGTVGDVLSSGVSDVSEVSIKTCLSEIPHELRFSWSDQSARNITLLGEPAGSQREARRAFGNLQYLSAEREGPRESHSMSSLPSDQIDVGHAGQFTAQVLLTRERSAVDPRLEHPEGKGLIYFVRQVELWLREIVPEIELRAEQAPDMGRIALRFRLDPIRGDWLRPGNLGFGVSYCLPIIVACLAAPKGSLVIIDTPEAHLHPSAQSRLGRFLSRAAAAGVQVLMETHSDHIINGVRLASIDGTGASGERVLINHLRRTEDGAAIEEISILANGELSSRPPEFFDQFENDLVEIIRRRREEVRAAAVPG